MRQADVLKTIGTLILDAEIEASPDNYELCHRFVSRSDPAVVKLFEGAVARSEAINAVTFQAIKDAAGPPRGQIDIEGHLATFDGQLASVLGATATAFEDVDGFVSSLRSGAERLRAGQGDLSMAPFLADLLDRTIAMSEHAVRLEESLQSASAELTSLREDLDRARKESGSDALTPLPNRRAFDGRLDDAVAVAHAKREPLSLAFCDIDHFKAFNDRWGHKLGDQVLRYVGSQMAIAFGDIGLPARFGGEEFVALLPDRGSGEAMDLVRSFCETVRARILKTRSDNREVGRVTLSVGIATLRRGENSSAFLERADTAMYAAKRAGRNRIEISV